MLITPPGPRGPSWVQTPLSRSEPNPVWSAGRGLVSARRPVLLVPAAYGVTFNVPFMLGWMLHWYGNVPAAVIVIGLLIAPGPTVPVSKLPLLAV
jgi:hypothetical protein